MRPEHQLLHGPALPAVLKVLEQGPGSAYQLASRLRTACPDALALGEGAIIALVHFLVAQGLAAITWQETVAGKQPVYSLTERGQQRLVSETATWQALAPLLASAEAQRRPLAGSEASA